MPYKNTEERKSYQKRYMEINSVKTKEYRRKYYLSNKDMIDLRNKEYVVKNKEKVKEYLKKYHADRSTYIPKPLKTEAEKKTYKDNWYKLNRDNVLKRAKDIASKKTEQKKKYDLEYNKVNSDKIRVRKRTYTNTQLKINPLFKLRQTLRHRIYLALKNKGYNKSGITRSLLGADFKTVKSFIENKFLDGMNWDNHGEWHIDHKIPLALAKNEQELMPLFHYTNLQPLWAKDNLQKSKKFDDGLNLHNPALWHEIYNQLHP